MLVFGLDPGGSNCGWAVVCGDTGVIKKVGMLKNTINALTDVPHHDFLLSHAELSLLASPCQRCIAERFQNRTRIGIVIEQSNILLGAFLSAVPREATVNLVTASTWKNRFNRFTPLKAIYTLAKKKKVPPHCVDAVLLAYYATEHRDYFYTQVAARPQAFVSRMAYLYTYI